MSYMGPRYVSGGGQIFPQNQSFQPQNMQRQYQMMQMQLQLQQKIQDQMQKQYNIKNEVQQQNIKGKIPQNQSNAGQNQGQSGQSLNNQGSKSNMNSNVNSKPQQQQQPIKPSQNQSQTNNLNNSRNLNIPPIKNLQDNKNQPQQQTQSQNKAGNKGPQSQNPNSNSTNISAPKNNMNTRPQPLIPSLPQNKGQVKNENSTASNMSKDKSLPTNQRFGNNPKDTPPTNQRFGNNPKDSSSNQQKLNQGPLIGQAPMQSQGMVSRSPVKTELKAERNIPNVNKGLGRSMQGNFNQDNYDSHNQDQYGRSGHSGLNQSNFNKSSAKGVQSHQGQSSSWGQSKNTASHAQDNSFNRPGKSMNNFGSDARQNMPKKSGGYGGGGGGGSGYKGKNFYGQDKIKEKITQIFTGPQTDLPALDTSEKKFNAYARLFIGNIPKNCEQKEVVTMFEKYGEIGSVYLNKESSFAFINFDYKVNAAKAMRELDNTMVKNRYLKVRFATISEGIRVKNLSPYVSNELLEKCFSIFGMIESCRVVVDDRGSSKGEGIIIFRDKKSAIIAVKKCQEECYFLSGALRPVIAHPLEPTEDNEDGLPESSIPKNDEYQGERNIAPHIADHGCFEYEFGMQWKQLYNMYDEKKATLDRDFQIEIERLEKKMVLAKVEYETEKLRKELAQREAESAELRRHFDYANASSAAMGPASPLKDTKMSCGSAPGNYDSYPVGKRPLDSGYESSSFNGPYDSSYSDNYDRGGYSASDYERNYDQGYMGGYGRDEFRRESGYGPDNPYDRSYERSGDIAPERPGFEPSSEQGYLSNPSDAPAAINEPYKAPSKRPRY